MSDYDVVRVSLIVGVFLGAVFTVLFDVAVTVWRHHQQHVAQQRRRQALQARLEAVQRQQGGWW